MNEPQIQTPECDYRWVAYELHDGLLQWMVGARMSLEPILGNSQLPSDVQDQLQRIQTLLDSGIEEGRALIAFLESIKVRPVIDVCESLHEFLDRMKTEAEQNGQTLQAHCPEPDFPEMPPENAWNLLRIMQQGVRNAIHHAGPCHISVWAGWTEDGQIKIEIRDDGVGFDPASVDTTQHFGLSGMRHRARLLKAELSIESAPGRGTRIVLKMDPATITLPPSDA